MVLNKTRAQIRAVYFDLDDTLCAYWEAAATGLRRTFADLCPDLGTPEELVGHWATEFRAFCTTLKQTGWYEGYLRRAEPTRTELMRLTLLRLGVDDTTRARQIGDNYADRRNESLRLFDDAKAILGELHGKVPMGLITNGPADTQRQEIATLGLAKYVDHVFIEGEMGRGKPLVEVFHQAEHAIGFEPKDLLFVGNSYAHDIVPAINAGWHTAWIRRPSDVPPSAMGEQARPESLPIGAVEPDLTINSLTELLQALGQPI